MLIIAPNKHPCVKIPWSIQPKPDHFRDIPATALHKSEIRQYEVDKAVSHTKN